MIPSVFATGELSWEVDGARWPHREASRFVDAAGLRWHVQVEGKGPDVLLLHGSGASTHSWRALLPALAGEFRVVAVDLPGHGFTARPGPSAFSLPGMSRAVGELLAAIEVFPALGVGHSAGSAVLARMALDGWINPRGLVSINGAFLPFPGIASPVYSTIARLLTRAPLVPWLFTRRAAERERVASWIRDTGSALDAEGVDLYARLARSSRHVGSALAMMAGWELQTLVDDLPALPPELLLIVGDEDRFVSPDAAETVLELVPSGQRVVLPGLGHLAHEEKPACVVELVSKFARAVDVL